MLEKPDIPLPKIAACLQNAYGVTAVQIIFLPFGADQNTAVEWDRLERHRTEFMEAAGFATLGLIGCEGIVAGHEEKVNALQTGGIKKNERQ